MKVKANRTIAYGSIEYSPGDVFDMDDKTANVNIANKRVSEVHGTGKENKPAPKPDEKPEVKPDEKPGKPETLPADPPRKERGEGADAGEGDKGDGEGNGGNGGNGDTKGRHKRRDMRAEDDDGEGVN
jgi:hypothetical protein